MASMAFDPQLHQLILFGGLGADGQPLGDTWAWNGYSWYQQNTSGPAAQSPGPRQGAAMSSDGNGDLVLFGGWGSPLPTPDSTTTTPTTDPGSSTTTIVPPASPASAVTSASAANSTSAGGTASASLTDASGQLLGDTWLWTRAGWIPGPAAGPSPRSEAAMALDTTTGQTILMGGQASPPGLAATPALADTWAWNGTAWSKLATPAAPSARAGAAMADDPLTGGLVLFGGMQSQTALGDTWLWNGDSWAAVRTPAAPPARAGAAAAFDGNSRELVVFGGTGAGGATLGDTEILTGQAPLVLAPGQASSASPPNSGGSRTTSHAPTTRGHGSGSHSPATTSATSEPTTATPGNGSTTPSSLGATTHQLHRGELVTLDGGGFASHAQITISFHSKPALVGETSANKEGQFSVTVAVPESAAAGLHHFMATGESRSGSPKELVAAVDVIGVPSGATPPLEVAVLVALAILMPLGTWCALAAAGWWRRRKPAAI
jgi:hypothetical protein